MDCLDWLLLSYCGLPKVCESSKGAALNTWSVRLVTEDWHKLLLSGLDVSGIMEVPEVKAIGLYVCEDSGVSDVEVLLFVEILV